MSDNKRYFLKSTKQEIRHFPVNAICAHLVPAGYGRYLINYENGGCGVQIIKHGNVIIREA